MRQSYAIFILILNPPKSKTQTHNGQNPLTVEPIKEYLRLGSWKNLPLGIIHPVWKES